jgi:hypothetical protein
MTGTRCCSATSVIAASTPSPARPLIRHRRRRLVLSRRCDAKLPGCVTLHWSAYDAGRLRPRSRRHPRAPTLLTLEAALAALSHRCVRTSRGLLLVMQTCDFVSRRALLCQGLVTCTRVYGNFFQEMCCDACSVLAARRKAAISAITISAGMAVRPCKIPRCPSCFCC